MRSAVGILLCLTLAACSKSEPPAQAVSNQPAQAGAELAPPSPAPKAETSGAASQPNPGGASSAPAAATPAASASFDEVVKAGEPIFKKTCATCHMADGSGVPYLQPSIKGSGWISAEDPQLLLSLILRGSAILGEAAKAYDNDMAPQDHLTDEQIAAVATYVRQRFAATPITKPVTPAEVALARSRPGLP